MTFNQVCIKKKKEKICVLETQFMVEENDILLIFFAQLLIQLK